MSRKFKSIICAILAGMMITTSGGFVALAEDTAAAETTVTDAATDTADLTDEEKEAEEEAAEAETEAPAEPEVHDYASDTYYQDALKLCSSLGIITGYDDGSVKPESVVTRAEMATIILRMLNMTADSTYANVFTDVKTDHWAANTIQTAVEQSIVDGMGDGTFVPDGNVKYEQVIKMIVCAMNYGLDAENAGGYPNGYISVGGTTLSLLKSVDGKKGEDMPRGEVIKSVYNAIMAPYRDLTGFDAGKPVYRAEDTLGVVKFNLYEEQGILTTTPNITIASGVQTKEGIVSIDGTQYKYDLSDADDLVGTKVKFYYIDDKADDPQIVAMVSDGKSETVTVDAELVEEMSVYGTNSGPVGKLAVLKSETSSATKKYDISSATVIYNGTIMTTADYAKSGNTKAYDDFIKPQIGSVKIVDYDADSKYDVVFVDSYETLIVTNATTKKLTGKINDSDITIEYDLDSNDQTIKVLKSGVEATVKNLRKNDVVSFKRNIDETQMEFIVTGDAITGEITRLGEDDGWVTVTINGQEYKVDKSVEDEVKIGVSGTFYLDAFDIIGYTETTSTGSEKYAVLANAYYDDMGELIIRLFDQDGTGVEAKTTGSTKFWAPCATSATTASDDEIYEATKSDSLFIQCDSKPVKLCKYKTNSSGKISLLYFATDEEEVSDLNALRVYNGSLEGVSSVGGAVSGYYIQNGIVQFTVPEAASDRKSTENYSVGEVSSSTYVNYDGGYNDPYTIGDFKNERYPQVLIKYAASSSDVSSDGIGNASNGPTFMVSRIVTSVDEEGEYVYELKGYSNGAEISYTTASNVGIYDFDVNNYEREYTGELIFNGLEDSEAILKSAVKPGDIFYVATNNGKATTLIKLLDTDRVAKAAIKGSTYDVSDPTSGQWQKHVSYSSTRDQYYCGALSNVDIGDSAFIDLVNSVDGSSLGSVTYDSSAVFSLVELTVDMNGNVIDTEVDKNGGIEPGEIMCYGDDPNEFDYGIFKMFKGGMREGYIVRVIIEE